MHDYGLLSLLPPICAIVLAIFSRQVYISLLFGIWLGWFILDDFQIFKSIFDTVEALVVVLQDSGNTRTIMFSALVGALIVFVQRSGGVEGFIRKVTGFLARYEARNPARKNIVVQLLAWITGMLIFVESSISVLTVGTLYRPIFDKFKISREKLAYIADSSSAPSCILIPLNGWGAFIMSLLLAQGFNDPFGTLIQASLVNFYPLVTLGVVLMFILINKDIGPMRLAEQRIKETGKFLREGAQPMVSDELTTMSMKSGIVPKTRNMIIPIGAMVVMMPVMLTITGWESAISQDPDQPLFRLVLKSIGQGSGSTSVLMAVISAIIISMLAYKAQGLFSIKEMIKMILKGISEMMPIVLLLLFAFAIGNVCRSLETGQYIADVTKEWLSPSLVPFIVFLVSCFIAFSTGTSFGTFAIIISIAVPVAQIMGAPVILTIAAALGGGVFGDHCSPISDTTILSSMAAATDHIDHVKTQIPYALIAGLLAAILYLIVGVFLT